MMNDNQNFKKGYWASAASEFKKLKPLTFAGLTVALAIILGLVNIPVALNLRISFAFLALAFGSVIYGPLVGLAAGFVFDILSFLIFPTDVFFPGYTLSNMLEFFTYGLFLYHRRISVLRVFLTKFTVNFAIHVCVGSLWSAILYGKGYFYFLTKSLLKNAIMLPIEVIMIVALMQVFLPLLVHEGFLPKPKGKFIPLI